MIPFLDLQAQYASIKTDIQQAVNRVFDTGNEQRIAAMPPMEGVECGAPSGIALSADERFAFVHCRSTDAIAKVKLDGDRKSVV